MGDATDIAWTGKTWNPWQGCQKVSPGCDDCYMFRDKTRFGQDPEKVVLSTSRTFNRPLVWNRDAAAAGRTDLVFLASWTDFFIKEGDEWRAQAWDIVRRCPNLIFQILTKRHGRIASCLPPDWSDGYPNVWLGVSAENAEWWDRRVAVLRDIPARTRFVSYEPAIGPIAGCSATGLDWVIIGGESGVSARPFDLDWAREAITICRRDGAAPFVKQLGAQPRQGPVALHLRDTLHGGEWDEWPTDLKVREYPSSP